MSSSPAVSSCDSVFSSNSMSKSMSNSTSNVLSKILVSFGVNNFFAVEPVEALSDLNSSQLIKAAKQHGLRTNLTKLSREQLIHIVSFKLLLESYKDDKTVLIKICFVS